MVYEFLACSLPGWSMQVHHPTSCVKFSHVPNSCEQRWEGLRTMWPQARPQPPPLHKPHTCPLHLAQTSHCTRANCVCAGLPGWATIFAPGARRNMRICVWAPKGVEVFLRPSLPTGQVPQVGRGSRRRGMRVACVHQTRLAKPWWGGGCVRGTGVPPGQQHAHAPPCVHLLARERLGWG